MIHMAVARTRSAWGGKLEYSVHGVGSLTLILPCSGFRKLSCALMAAACPPEDQQTLRAAIPDMNMHGLQIIAICQRSGEVL